MLVYEQDHYCVEEGLIIWIIWGYFFLNDQSHY